MEVGPVAVRLLWDRDEDYEPVCRLCQPGDRGHRSRCRGPAGFRLVIGSPAEILAPCTDQATVRSPDPPEPRDRGAGERCVVGLVYFVIQVLQPQPAMLATDVSTK